jgi:hypothetical protein
MLLKMVALLLLTPLLQWTHLRMSTLVDESMMDTVHTRNGTTNLTGTEEAAYTERLAKLKIILSGETPIQLT